MFNPFPWAAPAVVRRIIQVGELLHIRGGPSIVRLLAKLGVGRTAISITRLPTGERLYFPSVDPYWAPYLWGTRRYESDVECIFEYLADIPDKLLVDCGANIGYWTVRLSASRFGFTEFVAVEPNADLLPLLRRNIESNNVSCRIEAKAIAAKSGEIAYLKRTRDHAIASISEVGTPVETTSLDTLIHVHRKGGPAVVKLDVEGSEIAAIKGSQGVRHLDVIFIYEDWPRSGFPVTDFLLQSGYLVLSISLQGRVYEVTSLASALQFNREMNEAYGPSNFLACSAAVFDKFLRRST